MKRSAIAAAILACAAPFALAQTSTWVSDSMHSEVDFSIRHMSVSNVHGRFGAVNATIVYNPADVSKSSVNATIGVATVDTGEPKRDAHIKGPDFFDVAAFPTATFVSTAVARAGNGLKVTGNLTLHGVTHPVVLDVQGPGQPVPGMDHKPHAGFSAATTISRSAFAIGTGLPAGMVGDEVKLDIELEVVRQ